MFRVFKTPIQTNRFQTQAISAPSPPPLLLFFTQDNIPAVLCKISNYTYRKMARLQDYFYTRLYNILPVLFYFKVIKT
jgi:hypothetical protein